MTDASDTSFNLQTLQDIAHLTNQIQETESDCTLLVNSQPVRFVCFLTGDGAAMLTTHSAPRHSGCWLCNNPASLTRSSTVLPSARFSSILPTICPQRRVGDYVHCLARVCTAFFNRLVNTIKQSNTTGALPCQRALQAILNTVRDEAAHIPRQSSYPSHTHATWTMDLSEAKLFLSSTVHLHGVVQCIRNHLPAYCPATGSPLLLQLLSFARFRS